jgi:hypothetical protein
MLYCPEFIISFLLFAHFEDYFVVGYSEGLDRYCSFAARPHRSVNQVSVVINVESFFTLGDSCVMAIFGEDCLVFYDWVVLCCAETKVVTWQELTPLDEFVIKLVWHQALDVQLVDLDFVFSVYLNEDMHEVVGETFFSHGQTVYPVLLLRVQVDFTHVSVLDFTGYFELFASVQCGEFYLDDSDHFAVSCVKLVVVECEILE